MNVSVLPRASAAKPLPRASAAKRRPGHSRQTALPGGRGSPLAKSLTLAAMSLGYVVVQLDVTIVNVAINSIGASLRRFARRSAVDRQRLHDHLRGVHSHRRRAWRPLGAKRVFVLGFAIFVAASLACALAPTLWVLILARLCQGIGAAILVPNSLALLNHAYPNEGERHWAVGIWAAAQASH